MMRPFRFLLALVLLAVFVTAGLVGGPQFAPDLQTDLRFIPWRAEHVQLTRAVLAFTQLGGAAVLVPLCLATGLWMWLKRRRRDALLFLGCTMSGRLLIELIKEVVDRPRPSFDPYPVIVSVKSFPSGHAGNSTLTYVAIALFAVPERWRREALAAACTLAIAIGCTRPLLSVHWPSDVIAGWCLGLLWVGLWFEFSSRGGAAASGYSPASPAAPPE